MIRLLAALSVALLLAAPARAGPWEWHPTDGPARYRLAFRNLHTDETLDIEYRDDRGYHVGALAHINGFLADWRTHDARQMDPALLDLLHNIAVVLMARHPGLHVTYEVISGYRTPRTNYLLRLAGGSQAKNSQHIEGRAIDIRVPGVGLKELRDVAWCQQRGGVGYYESDGFVHIDTAGVRTWNWSPVAEHVRCGAS